MVSEKTHMANVEGDETMEELGSFVAVSDHSLLDDEQSMLGQQDLYGTITPSPIKEVKLGLKLPKLKEKLEFPKQRKRTSSFDVHVRKEKHGINQQKRPSTCGKEGVRNFSSPLPLKVKSLLDTSIPCLLPESVSSRPGQTLCVDSSDSSMDLSFHTPQMDRTKPTSPLSVRSFSTPLADIRSKSLQKTAVQIQLSQLSSKEYLEEAERQLQRDILKYQSEINMMRKIRKYRKSKEDEKLDNVIEEWKEVAQKASNYMLNEATYKIERMGGIEEFRKRQKKTKLRKLKFEFDESLLYRIEEFMETAEYRNMDSYEKEEVMSRKKELEEMSEKIERGEIPVDEDASENDDDGDFSMRELYKQLGLDYKLVYG